jgi:hypothetical protein
VQGLVIIESIVLTNGVKFQYVFHNSLDFDLKLRGSGLVSAINPTDQ